jgi:hypothetical protein
VKWLELFNKYKSQIDEQFGFLAFRTAPFVSSTTFDAKVTNSDLAPRQMLWPFLGSRMSANGCHRSFRRKTTGIAKGSIHRGIAFLMRQLLTALWVKWPVTHLPPCPPGQRQIAGCRRAEVVERLDPARNTRK